MDREKFVECMNLAIRKRLASRVANDELREAFDALQPDASPKKSTIDKQKLLDWLESEKDTVWERHREAEVLASTSPKANQCIGEINALMHVVDHVRLL